MSRWNEREHPRWPAGTPTTGNIGGGRFAGAPRPGVPSPGGHAWADQISGQIGRRLLDLGRDRGDGTRTVTTEQMLAARTSIRPGMYDYQDRWTGAWHPLHGVDPHGVAAAHGMALSSSPTSAQIYWNQVRIKPAGQPVQPHPEPAPRIGVPQGDGTYKITGEELAQYAAELEGRIDYIPQGDTENSRLEPQPVTFIAPGPGAGVTLEHLGYSSLLRFDSRVLISYHGEPTDEQRFFEMRMATGLESDEDPEDLLAHDRRYIGNIKVQDPQTGQWGVYQGGDYEEDELTGQDVIHIWVGEPGDESKIVLPDNPRSGYGRIRIRPISGQTPDGADDGLGELDEQLDQIAGAVGGAFSSPNLPRLQPGGGLPADTPADGRVDKIDDLFDATEHLDEGNGFGRFDGVEFFVENYGWIQGDEAQAGRLDSTIQIGGGEDAHIIGLDAGEEVSLAGKARWRHTDLRNVDMSQPPDPAWEYLIDSPDAGESIWWDGSDFDVVDGRWTLEGEWVDDYLETPLMGRPAVYPPTMEGLHTHPQKTTVGARLLDNLPAWTGGGYQIYNPDTGTWHTIEEIYQDDPDEEEIELIADGYHLPHLDTSDEIVVRPIPVGD